MSLGRVRSSQRISDRKIETIKKLYPRPDLISTAALCERLGIASPTLRDYARRLGLEPRKNHGKRF